MLGLLLASKIANWKQEVRGVLREHVGERDVEADERGDLHVSSEICL